MFWWISIVNTKYIRPYHVYIFLCGYLKADVIKRSVKIWKLPGLCYSFRYISFIYIVRNYHNKKKKNKKTGGNDCRKRIFVNMDTVWVMYNIKNPKNYITAYAFTLWKCIMNNLYKVIFFFILKYSWCTLYILLRYFLSLFSFCAAKTAYNTVVGS